MDLLTLRDFFMWCTVLNGALLVVWAVGFACASDLVYRFHSRWFPLSKDAFVTLVYGLLGGFKILWIVFNLVPYLALLILGALTTG